MDWVVGDLMWGADSVHTVGERLIGSAAGSLKKIVFSLSPLVQVVFGYPL